MTFLIRTALRLLLDVVVLVALGAILGRKKRPIYPKLAIGSLVVAAAYAAYDLLPRLLLGHLFVVPIVVAAGIVLAVFGRLGWKQAAVGSGIFFVTHVVAGWII
jgi:uncharacterized membrane protein YoaK (UPF0700 family)